MPSSLTAYRKCSAQTKSPQGGGHVNITVSEQQFVQHLLPPAGSACASGGTRAMALSRLVVFTKVVNTFPSAARTCRTRLTFCSWIGDVFVLPSTRMSSNPEGFLASTTPCCLRNSASTKETVSPRLRGAKAVVGDFSRAFTGFTGWCAGLGWGGESMALAANWAACRVSALFFFSLARGVTLRWGGLGGLPLVLARPRLRGAGDLLG